MPFSRRALLAGGSVAAASLVLPRANAQLSSLSSGGGSSFPGGLLPDRPRITHGVASGDMRPDGALIWSRADRPSRMIVETAPTEAFRNPRIHRARTLAGPTTDGTAKLRLEGLEAGQDIFYRVQMEDALTGLRSEPVIGSFRTSPATARDIRFHWTADVAGQGYGINPDIGGMFGWKTMAERNPDFFLHSGDVVYADGVIEETKTTPDGKVWRNVVTPEKAQVAQTLDDYRGQYAYNLLDDNYRAFNARVPQLVQWDDHETTNNWYPGEILDDDRYTEKRVDVLAARSFQAFNEWQPVDNRMAADGRLYRKVSYGPLLEVFMLDMRTYKDDNTRHTSSNREPGHILGAEQKQWLIDSLHASTATWKVIANDLPLGIIVPDGEVQEGVASGTPGEPVGRESELAQVLSAIKDVDNVVFLTGDVHYAAAHEYHPDRAAFKDFAPFWEFVSGPFNAGGFGPNDMDPTFGPRVDFVHAPAQPDDSPLGDFQHFGEVDINAATREFTVRILTTRGQELYSKTLPAA